MKTFTVASTLAFAAFAQALDVPIVNDNGTISCPGTAAGHNFCAGNSLATNIIIRCIESVGQPGNCNDNLAGVPPVGVKTFAPCYQSSASAGDAACSYDGVAYPDGGAAFVISTGQPVSSSSSSAGATYSISASSSSATSVSATYSIVSPSESASSAPASSSTESSVTIATYPNSTPSSTPSVTIATYPSSSPSSSPVTSSIVTIATYPNPPLTTTPGPSPIPYPTAPGSGGASPGSNGTSIVVPTPSATIVPGAATVGKSIGGLAVAAAIGVFAYLL